MFDKTLVDISNLNAKIFSVSTATNARITLFDPISQYISDPSQKDPFCRALINKVVNFSFEKIFDQKFDFFSTIFEYLIKDYNKDGGGKYAEYYTPHAVSKIMAKILVDKPEINVTVYDPSAGSGTLLMNVAHEIGEKNCSIYSQDISQKSTGMLRLNLILNDLVHSIPNVIQGNTLKEPAHRDKGGLKKFDFIVSNPPFKLDFSDFRDDLTTPDNKARFFAGVASVPKQKFDSMPIYLMFMQHIISSLSDKGKSAIVVPNGFLTSKDSIEKKIKEKILKDNILRGVVAMPSNIFANTSTKVSILFLDNDKTDNSVVLIDASHLGTVIKEGKNTKTLLSAEDEDLIIGTFNNNISLERFSQVVDGSEIEKNGLSINPGQYFKIPKTVHKITQKDFDEIQIESLSRVGQLFSENISHGKQIVEILKGAKLNDSK